jgi:hypothetical protein
MKCFPKSLVAVVAIIGVVGIAFVLITPAPDELPSTGPHALHNLFLPPSDPIAWAQTFLAASHQQPEFVVVRRGIDVLSLICTRLC